MKTLALVLILFGSILGIFSEKAAPESFKFYMETIGRLTFLTFWSIYVSLTFSLSYLFVSTVQLVFKILKKPDNSLAFLKHIPRAFFTISLCCTAFVVFAYWPLRIYDQYYFIPKFFKGKLIINPIPLDLLYHFVPFFLLAIIWIDYPMVTSLVAHGLLMGVFCWFIAASNLKFIRVGYWPYAFMKDFSVLKTNLMYAGYLVVTSLIFFGFRFLESKRPVRKQVSKQKVRRAKKAKKQ